MKVKILALAAFGLLAMATATANSPTNNVPSARDGKINAAAAVNDGPIDPAIGIISNNDCQQYCTIPMAQCMQRCGNGPDCEHKCSCELFGKRNLCVLRGCVAKPDCNKQQPLTERDGQDGEPSSFIPPPPMPPCVLCRAAIKRCIDDCGNTPKCDQDCRCLNNGCNRNCDGCDDAYCYGHRSKERDEQEGELTTDEYLTKVLDNPFADVPEDTGPQPDSGIGGWPPGTMFNVCDQCTKAVNQCKEACGDDPACGISCACEKKKTADSCKACGKFKPKCKWPRASEEEAMKAVDISPKIRPPGPPVTHCVACTFAVNDCKKRCKDSTTCELNCPCVLKQTLEACKRCNTASKCKWVARSFET